MFEIQHRPCLQDLGRKHVTLQGSTSRRLYRCRLRFAIENTFQKEKTRHRCLLVCVYGTISTIRSWPWLTV